MSNDERDKIFYENEKLIWYTIFRFFKYHTTRHEDLWQVGAMTMLQYIPHYDAEKGGSLANYLIKCMHGRMSRYIMRDTTVTIPITLYNDVINDENKPLEYACLDKHFDDGYKKEESVSNFKNDYAISEIVLAMQQELNEKEYNVMIDMLKGYTLEESAEKNGLSFGSLKQYRHLAKKKLKERLK